MHFFYSEQCHKLDRVHEMYNDSGFLLPDDVNVGFLDCLLVISFMGYCCMEYGLSIKK